MCSGRRVCCEVDVNSASKSVKYVLEAEKTVVYSMSVSVCMCVRDVKEKKIKKSEEAFALYTIHYEFAELLRRDSLHEKTLCWRVWG